MDGSLVILSASTLGIKMAEMKDQGLDCRQVDLKDVSTALVWDMK